MVFLLISSKKSNGTTLSILGFAPPLHMETTTFSQESSKEKISKVHRYLYSILTSIEET